MRVYIAPDNPAGRALAQQLCDAGVTVLGRVDNLKQGEGVINHRQAAEDFDYVLLARSDFQSEIADGLMKNGFDRKQILRAQGDVFVNSSQPSVKQRLMAWTTRVLNALWDLLPKRHIVYYAERYADTNVLVAFDEHLKRNGRIKLLVKDAMQQSHPLQISHPLVIRWALQCARVIVVDHESTDAVFNHLRTSAKVIQLWHGLPFKHLAGNRHFPHVMDEAFVSSSAWFNREVFPSIFKARQYLDLGYPRSDALLQKREQRCWHNCVATEEMDALLKGRRLIVYMPTYRDDGNNAYPIDWQVIDAFLAEHNSVLMLKTHPFLSPNEELALMDGCEQVFQYPGRKNIYPWLAEADLLITDYSSVSFDFMLRDKPIVHFCYDMENYRSVRGQFLVEPEGFMAGPLVGDDRSLMSAIAQQLTEDTHKSVRDKLLKEYRIEAKLASPRIASLAEHFNKV